MSIFKRLLGRSKKSTASVAKERLQIIISHERGQRSGPDYIPQLQKEIVDVIAKYVKIDKDQIKVQIDRVGENSVLELNVTMPTPESITETTKEKEAEEEVA